MDRKSRFVFVLLACVPLLTVFLVGMWALLTVPSDSILSLSRATLLVYLGILGFLTVLPLFAFARLRVPVAARPAPQPGRVELLMPGIEPGDQALIAELFPNSADVRLRPITGGYSGAVVCEAQSWSNTGALQRPSVVKIGSAAKLQPEVENYERYVREYVGNTASLMGSTQRNGRMALRWAYAAFSGDQTRSLAELAAAGQPLSPILSELFSSRATMGLLLGAARRDPQRALYREYSWTPAEWERLLQAAAPLLDGQSLRPTLPWDATLPNPLAVISRFCDPQTGQGERCAMLFDSPVATVHGDLNSRNILLDGRQTIFIIDFSHTQPGHMLRDFARLEIELLLVLNQPGSAEAASQHQQFCRTLLPAATHHRLTLRDVLACQPQGSQLADEIRVLRQRAHDLAGPWLGEPALHYLLPLLHATIESIRYAQVNQQTRRTALFMGALLCQLLADSDSPDRAQPQLSPAAHR